MDATVHRLTGDPTQRRVVWKHTIFSLLVLYRQNRPRLRGLAPRQSPETERFDGAEEMSEGSTPGDDPRDRSYPARLRVTVGAGDEPEGSHAIATSEKCDTVAFDSFDELGSVLTDRRIDLLQTLVEIDSPVEDMDSLAADLDLDRETLQDDLAVLADHELLFVVEEGETKRPYLPYDRIQLDVEIATSSTASRRPERDHRSSTTITDQEIAALREEIRNQIDEKFEETQPDGPSWLNK